jgi:hypothetical protein
MASTKPKRIAPDWERIKSDYRAGMLSVREIAASHGISHTAIQKRVKAGNWEQDLSNRIQAKADTLVAKALVATEVATESQVATDEQIVAANAEVIAQVRLRHRKDIVRFRALALNMLGELEVQTVDIDLFEELGELLRSEDERGNDKRNDVYRKVISGANRIGGLKQLAETLKILVALEREAYGLVDTQAKGDSIDGLAERLEAARKRVRV